MEGVEEEGLRCGEWGGNRRDGKILDKGIGGCEDVEDSELSF